MIVFQTEGYSQQTFTLNSIDTQSKQISAFTITGEQQQRQYFSLNDEPIRNYGIQKGDRIEVQTSHSDHFTLIVTRIESYTNNTVSYLATDESNPENTFTFTYFNGRLHGLYHRSHDDIYFFEYDPDARQNYVVKRSSFYDDKQFCNVHEAEIVNQPFWENVYRGKSADVSSGGTHVPDLSAMASSMEDEITIDIMIPYTENARVWAESSSFNSIDAVIANAMALSQTALDNSEIYINLRLVHYYESQYKDDSLENLDDSDPAYVSASDHLRRLTRNPDNNFNLCGGQSSCKETDYDGYMEEAHQLRDQYGADLVATVMSEPNTGGLAWLSTSVTGNSARAFSVTRVQQIGIGYTLIHELGHNMGSTHARNQNESAAGDFGGLFAYSTGNRFSSSTNDYATVMSYAQDGFQATPHFSNPDIQVSGISTGHNITYTGEAGPSDNARSLNEIKRVIASYRPSMTDPPVVDVEESSISATLNQENSTVTVPITIRNHGDSDLMWDMDFDISSGVVTHQKRQPVTDMIESDPDFTQFAAGNMFAATGENGVVFSTNFEGAEGFSTGDHAAIAGWRAFATAAPFEISNENPSSGTKHLRLPRRSGTSNSVFTRSPFFGPQPMGEFSVRFDLATRNLSVGGNAEVFDVYIYDASTATISAGIIISEGTIFAWTVNESGDEVFGSTNTTFPENGSYRSMEIRYNPNNKTIDYYMDGSQIASNPYPRGRKPDYIYFGQRNDVSGAYMDVDNVEVKRIHTPFNWLKVSKTGGVVSPSSTQTVDLTLNAVDVETGTYQTVLQVRSNDPDNPLIEVPVTVDVEMATSAQSTGELPDRISLSQNYPNPFNPSTRIQFNLTQTTNLKLEVFTLTGQKVATLVEEILNAGRHEHIFDASGLSSGLYIYRLQTPEESLTRQMILIK
ncbi:hypothetical protein BH23BAC3_BH23BAC3_05850 [soil metagenome]